MVATVWGMWPASADRLYARIISISAARGPADAKKHIDEFIERFPHDARLAEVDNLRMDVECQSLQKNLALREMMSGGSALEPFEQRFLEAMRLKPKNPAAARVRFLELVELYRNRNGNQSSPKLEMFLDAAQHQLNRLAPD